MSNPNIKALEMKCDATFIPKKEIPPPTYLERVLSMCTLYPAHRRRDVKRGKTYAFMMNKADIGTADLTIKTKLHKHLATIPSLQC
eukprot:scaffold125871_cov65-Attheya_sp.AAC.3